MNHQKFEIQKIILDVLKKEPSSISTQELVKEVRKRIEIASILTIKGELLALLACGRAGMDDERKIFFPRA